MATALGAMEQYWLERDRLAYNRRERERQIIQEQNDYTYAAHQEAWHETQAQAYRTSVAILQDADFQSQELSIQSQEFLIESGQRTQTQVTRYAASGALVQGSAMARLDMTRSLGAEGAQRLQERADIALMRGRLESQAALSGAVEPMYVAAVLPESLQDPDSPEAAAARKKALAGLSSSAAGGGGGSGGGGGGGGSMGSGGWKPIKAGTPFSGIGMFAKGNKDGTVNIGWTNEQREKGGTWNPMLTQQLMQAKAGGGDNWMLQEDTQNLVDYSVAGTVFDNKDSIVSRAEKEVAAKKDLEASMDTDPNSPTFGTYDRAATEGASWSAAEKAILYGDYGGGIKSKVSDRNVGSTAKQRLDNQRRAAGWSEADIKKGSRASTPVSTPVSSPAAGKPSKVTQPQGGFGFDYGSAGSQAEYLAMSKTPEPKKLSYQERRAAEKAAFEAKKAEKQKWRAEKDAKNKARKERNAAKEAAALAKSKAEYERMTGTGTRNY